MSTSAPPPPPAGPRDRPVADELSPAIEPATGVFRRGTRRYRAVCTLCILGLLGKAVPLAVIVLSVVALTLTPSPDLDVQLVQVLWATAAIAVAAWSIPLGLTVWFVRRPAQARLTLGLVCAFLALWCTLGVLGRGADAATLLYVLFAGAIAALCLWPSRRIAARRECRSAPTTPTVTR